MADYAAERNLVLIFVLMKNPSGGGQAPALAAAVSHWAEENPGLYQGAHWPRAT